MLALVTGLSYSESMSDSAWISTAEAAEILGKSRATALRAVHSGAVDWKRTGSRGWLSVRAADVEALIQKSRKGADAAGVAAGPEDKMLKAS